MSNEEIEQASKVYRQYREECGVGSPTELDEIESAYYMGMKKMQELIMRDFKRKAFDKFCKEHNMKPGDIVECKNYGTVQFVGIDGSYMPWVVIRKVDSTGFISQNKKTRPLKQFEYCKVVGHKDLDN